MLKRTHFFSPSRTILLSVTFAILIGTALLALPAARTRPLPLIDLFFTATSCTCVTGLMTIPIDSFNTFGLTIIMILIQIGGLGLITLTFFIVSLFTNLGLGTQVMAGEMLELDSWKDTRKILLFIIILTLIFESIGALFLFQTFKHDLSFFDALFFSLFHAVSSFCNAGITPFPNGLIPYAQNYNVLFITALLMIIGGLGFMTWKELIDSWNPFNKKIVKTSLQTKIIISYYAFFVIASALLFWLLERNNTFDFMSLPMQITNAFFLSVTSRSGGYLTVYPSDLQHASIFTIMINGFIGAAPGSTGSGVKLTTAAIFIATIHAAIRNKSSIDIRGRRIMKDQVYKALAVVSLSLLWVLFTIFCLLITEKSFDFLDIVFETISAFSTLGASTGITPYLSVIGKLLITLNMFIGRIGSLTLMIALRKTIEKTDFSYPEERIMIT